MTDLVTSPSITEPGPLRERMLPTLAAGLLGGFALGIVARAWMRLIAEDPEFTWSGTLFIVIGFTIFGCTQSIVVLATRRWRRRWALNIVRVVGVAGLLPLFIGAGALMVPTVVGGGLSLARVRWHGFVRVILLVVAGIPVVIVGSQLVDDFGWSLHTAAGFFAMLAVYATIVRAARCTFAAREGGHHLPRWASITLFVVLGLAFVQLVAGFVLG